MWNNEIWTGVIALLSTIVIAVICAVTKKKALVFECFVPIIGWFVMFELCDSENLLEMLRFWGIVVFVCVVVHLGIFMIIQNIKCDVKRIRLLTESIVSSFKKRGKH